MVLVHIQLYYWQFVALINTKTKSFRSFFFLYKYNQQCRFESLGIRSWPDDKIYYNKPPMFNYFRRAGPLMGRIFRLWEDPAVRMGGYLGCGTKRQSSSGRYGLGVRACASLLLEPLPDSIMGREKPQFDKSWGGRGPIWWPPLWEYCKLCFPEALGTPHQSLTCRHGKRCLGPRGGGGASCERQHPSMVDEPVIHAWHRIKPVY